jgi:hypothetical protein
VSGPGKRTGGCLCGAVRYEVEWPPRALVICHCSDCQKQAGSAFSVVGITRRDHLKLSGELSRFVHSGSSGQPVTRLFCGDCGSPVLTDTPEVEKRGNIFFQAGTLDDTTDLAPTAHYWTASAQRWFAIPEDITCFVAQ